MIPWSVIVLRKSNRMKNLPNPIPEVNSVCGQMLTCNTKKKDKWLIKTCKISIKRFKSVFHQSKFKHDEVSYIYRHEVFT